MDGLAFSVAADGAAGEPRDGSQCTLKAPISCVGVGLHTGQRVTLSFRPAPADHGIVFRRTDWASTFRRASIAWSTRASARCWRRTACARRHRRTRDGGARRLRHRQCRGRARWTGAADLRRLRRAVRVPAGLRRQSSRRTRRAGRSRSAGRFASATATAFAELRPGRRTRPRHGAVDRLRGRRRSDARRCRCG